MTSAEHQERQIKWQRDRWGERETKRQTACRKINSLAGGHTVHGAQVVLVLFPSRSSVPNPLSLLSPNPNPLTTSGAPPQKPYPKTAICLAAEIDEDSLAGPALSYLSRVWEWRGSAAAGCTGHPSCSMYTVGQVIPQKSPGLCRL